MSLVSSYIFPHPPIIVHDIGKGEEIKAHKTIDGVKLLSECVKNDQPDTIILITPHGPVFEDAVSISVEERLSGDFGMFRAPNLKYSFDNDIVLAEKIIHSAWTNNISIAEINEKFAKQFKISTKIDHGALVPLHFVNEKYANYKLVHISIGLLSYEDLFKFGMYISRVLEEYNSKVTVIASADLSHRLTNDAPAGYNEKGKLFDEQLVKYLKDYDIEKLFDMDKSLIECAGECGLRPIIIMLGILDRFKIKPNIVSYEGPYGVGYCTARFEILSAGEESSFNKIMDRKNKRIQRIRNSEDEYVKLARYSLESYIKTNKIIEIPPEISDELINNSAGVFVSIKSDGQLRGCIGTIMPTKSNIAEEIIYNAVSAGTKDPRFFPVEANELEDLVYSVDILKEPEAINSKNELDVKRYGVIVRKGGRTGLLLPNLEGVETVDEQISIALSKAGIRENESYSLERFEVIRHGAK